MRCRTACAACEFWLNGCAPSPLLRDCTKDEGREGGRLGGCDICGGVHSPLPFAGYPFGVLGWGAWMAAMPCDRDAGGPPEVG